MYIYGIINTNVVLVYSVNKYFKQIIVLKMNQTNVETRRIIYRIILS